MMPMRISTGEAFRRCSGLHARQPRVRQNRIPFGGERPRSLSAEADSFAHVTDVRFQAPDVGASAAPLLDPSQRRVLSLGDAASAVVIGAPGSGKTTTLVEAIAERVLG